MVYKEMNAGVKKFAFDARGRAASWPSGRNLRGRLSPVLPSCRRDQITIKTLRRFTINKRSYWIGFLILTLAFLSFAACAAKTSDVFLLPEQKARTLTPPHRIVVYDKLADVPGEFDEIGLISVKGSAMWTRKASMIKELQETASRYGANALYIHTGKDIGVLGKVLTTYYTLGLIGRKSLQAVMIYLHDGSKQK